MRMMRLISSPFDGLPDAVREFLGRRALEAAGAALIGGSGATALALASWSVADPSINHAVNGTVHNLAGYPGAVVSDVMMQMVGLASSAALMPPLLLGVSASLAATDSSVCAAPCHVGPRHAAASGFASACPTSARWPLPSGLGGVAGDAILGLFATFSMAHGVGRLVIALALAVVAVLALTASVSMSADAERAVTLEDDEPVPMPGRAAIAPASTSSRRRMRSRALPFSRPAPSLMPFSAPGAPWQGASAPAHRAARRGARPCFSGSRDSGSQLPAG